MVELLPYGAVPGSVARMENSNDLAWFSSRGLVVGSQDGQVKNVQEETLAVGKAQAGALLFRDQDGVRQIVSAMTGVFETVAPATTFLSADEARKENML